MHHLFMFFIEHLIIKPLRERSNAQDRALTGHWYEWDHVEGSKEAQEPAGHDRARVGRAP